MTQTIGTRMPSRRTTAPTPARQEAVASTLLHAFLTHFRKPMERDELINGSDAVDYLCDFYREATKAMTQVRQARAQLSICERIEKLALEFAAEAHRMKHPARKRLTRRAAQQLHARSDIFTISRISTRSSH